MSESERSPGESTIAEARELTGSRSASHHRPLLLAAITTALAAACGSVVVESSETGGAAGSTSTSTTTPTTGGGGSLPTDGGDPQCASSKDCPSFGACAHPVCQAGFCGFEPAPPGASCPEGVCDGKAHCVECVTASDCAPSQLCINNSCLSTCTNGIWDGDEVDVDCGGSCPPCAM